MNASPYADMERIGVFCSSHKNLRPSYVEAARMLGREIGQRHLTLVYGGSRCGLMEVVARAVKENGGRVYGMIPSIIRERNLVSPCVDVEFHTENLSDRKDAMLRESDILVALPGGIGTLDEVFSVVAAATIGYHSKKVVLCNVDGFWNPMLHMLSAMRQEGLISSAAMEHLLTANSPGELNRLLFEP